MLLFCKATPEREVIWWLRGLKAVWDGGHGLVKLVLEVISQAVSAPVAPAPPADTSRPNPTSRGMKISLFLRPLPCSPGDFFTLVQV